MILTLVSLCCFLAALWVAVEVSRRRRVQGFSSAMRQLACAATQMSEIIGLALVPAFERLAISVSAVIALVERESGHE